MSMRSPVARLLAALVLVTTLAACSTLGGTGLVASTVTAKLTPDAATTIAGDMVGQLAELAGPGSTTIALTQDGSTFGQALEAALKTSGYAIVTDQKTKGTVIVPLAYVVDQDQDNILVRLSTASFDITRMYALGAGGATPSSPVSVMQRSTGASS